MIGNLVVNSANIRIETPSGKKGKKLKYKITDADRQNGFIDFKISTDLIPDEKPAETQNFRVSLSGTIPPNRPPVITSPDVFSAKVGTLVKIDITVTDPDNDLLDITWSQISGETVQITLEQGKQTMRFTAPSTAQELKFNVSANDTKGGIAAKDIIVKIVNEVPVTCPAGQCKDPSTLACRPLGLNEIVDENGFCKLKDPEPTGQLKLAFYADDDTNNNSVATRKGVKAFNADKVGFGGDGPYAEEGKTWTQDTEEAGYMDKLIISQGNHEHEESESVQTERDLEEWWDAFVDANPGKGYTKLTDTPEVDPNQSSWEKSKWLSFNVIKNAAIISMNSQDEDLPFRRNQFNYVMKQLAKVKTLKEQGTIDWVIVMIHKPWFTLKSSRAAYTAARAIYSERFKNVVDFVISGRNHNLQLWKPMLANPQDPANDAGIQLFSMTPDGTAFDFTKDRGFFQIVTGNAGREHNAFREGVENHPNIIYANDTDYGFVTFLIDGKKCKVSAVKSNGDELKSYLVTKGENKPVLKAVIKPVTPFTAIGQTVTLDGTLSTGASGFKWEKVSGDTVTLTGSDTPTSTFKVPDTKNDFVFKLTVVNEALETSEATVTVKNNIPDPEKIDAEAELLIFKNVGEVVELDGSRSTGPITNFEWKREDNSGLVIVLEPVTNGKKYSMKFTATQEMVGKDIKFRLRVFNAAGAFNDDVGGTTVTVKGTDPGGKVLWDSNIHLKTGQEYTIDGSHGNTGPDGKGIVMAASGNPQLNVHADGSFDLEADAGHGRAYIMAKNYNAVMEGEIMIDDDFSVVRNSTWRLRSRHQEGGDCSNRGGGFGATFEMEEQLAEYETESCHNLHENSIKKPLAKKVQKGQWIKFKYYCCNEPGDQSVAFKTLYDYGDGAGFVEVNKGRHPNPPSRLMDKALNEKNSYAWLRINNEGRGKVHYKNVRIIEITSIP